MSGIIKNIWLNSVLIILTSVFFSCNSTKLIPDNHYLLDNNKIILNSEEIKLSEIEDFIQQKPNRSFLWTKPYLNFYNLTHNGKKRKFLKFTGFYKLGNIIGEEPVILDSSLIEKTKKQFNIYLKNRGYYNSKITDSIYLKHKKAEVYYFIETYKPYIINNVKYSFKDPSIKKLILSDTVKSFIKPGKRFDIDYLDKERNRITVLMNNNAYYFFNTQYIHYEIDSNLNNKKVNIKLIIDNFDEQITANDKIKTSHKKYKIASVSVIQDYDIQQAYKQKDKYFDSFDTITVKGIKFYFRPDFLVNQRALAKHIYIKKDEFYNLKTVKETYRHLSRMGAYRLVNIRFLPNNDNHTLDCIIQLSPFASQSYTAQLEGTNSSGNLGIAGNLQYNHNSLFGGGENFNIKFFGGIEMQTAVTGDNNEIIPFNAKEAGIETSIRFPVFLLPFRSDKFIRNQAPKTIISFSFDYQNRPDYKRSISTGRFGYLWRSIKYFKHNFNLLSLSSIDVPYKNPVFVEEVLDKNPGLKYSFDNQFIIASNYIVTFSNQKERKNKNYFFTRFLIESSGNLLNLYNKNFDKQPNNEAYKIFGIQYSQYLKTDADIRYYQKINEFSKLVYRAFGGISYAYGNSEVVPYDKQYFSGGANGLRAWQIRSLGPGSYYKPNEIRIYQTSDIKLEFNLEYRFKLFWILESALFTDAGNIWAVNKLEQSPDAKFTNTFYKQLAVDGGIGLRFDFSFFLLRFDYGWKLRDPKERENKRWIIFSDNYDFFSSKTGTFNFSIGYPF